MDFIDFVLRDEDESVGKPIAKIQSDALLIQGDVDFVGCFFCLVGGIKEGESGESFSQPSSDGSVGYGFTADSGDVSVDGAGGRGFQVDGAHAGVTMVVDIKVKSGGKV